MNFAFTLTVPLSLFWLASQAQQPAEQPAAPAKCAIEGRVIHAFTGAPLKKVTVSLYKVEGQDRPAVARSDASGRFVFRDAESGKYRLIANRTGYAHQQYGSRGRWGTGTVLTLEAGQQMTGLVFRLYPQGVIAGVVIDEEGEPVVDAQIQALRHFYERRKRELGPVGHARTNDLGEFRVFGLEQGRYYLSASSASHWRWGISPRPASGTEPEQDYASTYYPGTIDPASAAQIEVAPGAEARVQIILRRVPTLRVRGRVVNPFATGRERETFVSLIPAQQAWGVVAWRSYPVTDAEGNFEVRGVVPGSYTLNAHWSHGEERRVGRKKLEVTANVDGVLVEIAAGFELAGSLKVEGETDINYADLRAILQPREEDPMGGGSVTVKDDGAFTFRNVAPDHYRFSLHGAPENCYIRSVRLGRQETLESGFDLTGPAAEPLEVFLSADGGRVEGEVVDDRKKPVRGAQVALVPDPPKRELSHLYKSATTDQSGKFSLAGIAPGDYKLFAWDSADPGAWEDPDFLKPFEEFGKSVRAGPNSKETASLPLLLTGEPAPTAPAARPPKPRVKGTRR